MVTAAVQYDALGRRVEPDVDSDVERYIYSGYETVSVYDGSNNWVRDFIYGSRIDEILAMDQVDVLDFDEDENASEVTRSFYHLSALGSVMAITEMDEDVAVEYRYTPYGQVTITRNFTPQASDPLGNPWMYTGRMTDKETGLYYCRARYYDPGTGRFLQRDPLDVSAGPSLNEHAKSRPTVLKDPLGLDSSGWGVATWGEDIFSNGPVLSWQKSQDSTTDGSDQRVLMCRGGLDPKWRVSGAYITNGGYNTNCWCKQLTVLFNWKIHHHRAKRAAVLWPVDPIPLPTGPGNVGGPWAPYSDVSVVYPDSSLSEELARLAAIAYAIPSQVGPVDVGDIVGSALQLQSIEEFKQLEVTVTRDWVPAGGYVGCGVLTGPAPTSATTWSSLTFEVVAHTVVPCNGGEGRCTDVLGGLPASGDGGMPPLPGESAGPSPKSGPGPTAQPGPSHL